MPDLPVAPVDMSTLPGVQMAAPPVEYLGSIAQAIDKFAAGKKPGEGGVVGVAVVRTDGTINVNLAVVHKFTDHISVLGWVGKEGSWGEPWEAGFAWKTEWGK
jgi:hypothetical protein